MSGGFPPLVRVGLLLGVLAALVTVAVNVYSGDDAPTHSSENITERTIEPVGPAVPATQRIVTPCPLGSQITDGSVDAPPGLHVSSEAIRDDAYYELVLQSPSPAQGPLNIEITVTCEEIPAGS